MVATETHFVLEGFILVLSASALGGLRWGLTQLLMKKKKMGLDNPAATIYWLSPIMAVTLSIISMAVEGWGSLFSSEFFGSVWITMQTMLLLLLPGIIAFCMVLSEF
jgi:solute carrier family 35 protein C2